MRAAMRGEPSMPEPATPRPPPAPREAQAARAHDEKADSRETLADEVLAAFAYNSPLIA
jgi:hypothetical protein